MTYPPPPWHTHGDGAGALYAVPARAIALPPGVEAISLFGRCAGVLAFIEYKPPSPLCYRELIWMPCAVKLGGHRGYWVEKMYVDDERSLAAGRELWALPKTLARFERIPEPEGERIEVRAEDGTALTLVAAGFGPRAPLRHAVDTLQQDAGAPVRFRCNFAGRLQLARFEVVSFDSADPGWSSYRASTRLPGSAGLLHGFEATMHPARR